MVTMLLKPQICKNLVSQRLNPPMCGDTDTSGDAHRRLYHVTNATVHKVYTINL